MAALDSVGGKGGDGKIGLPLLSYTQMKGKDATGLGSGGGGGGIALKINKPIEEYHLIIHLFISLKITRNLVQLATELLEG